MVPLRGKTIADSNNSETKLYKSLGSLIHDYRQCYNLSQEKISELIGISVRELRNWETDRCHARIENLHDLSEVTGIPMQVCVALNADQPIWYSLQERRFAYSSMEAQFYSHELYKFSEQLGDSFIVRAERVSKDKHISMILSYHREIYHTVKPLLKDVIKKAAMLLPDLNHIIFDSWGHYVGHIIFLPLRSDIYEKIKMQESFEHYLTCDRINDILSINEGVYFNYSSYAASINASHQNIVRIARYFAKIKEKKRYIVAGYSPVEETCKLYNKIGMSFARDYRCSSSEIWCKLYEVELDALIRPKQPLWNLLSTIEQSENQAFPKNLIKKARQNIPLRAISIKSDNNSSKLENDSPEKLHGYNSLSHDVPLSVGDMPLSVGGRKYDDKKESTDKTYSVEKEVCQNPECTLYNKTNKDNIISYGTYRTKADILFHRNICKECGKSFSCREAGIFYSLYGLRSPEEKILMALKHLVEGMPIQRVAKIIGIKPHTIQHWLKVISEQNGKIDAMLERKLNVSSAELADLWNFVKNNALHQRAALYKRHKDKGLSPTFAKKNKSNYI
ncbi:MAG: helix-turn-helix domain-containing protein [Proteobacteria bacterium]|nr:helix-turn-helix domain-containing protein [Pseudomonadota bacterium]